jgi:hypothetical protein
MNAPRHSRVRGPHFLCAFAIALALAAITSRTVETQIGLSPTAPSWAGTLTASSSGGLLTVGNTLLTPDPSATQEELPGLGHKFQLFGVMVKDTDPQNSVGGSGAQGGGVGGNETISDTMTTTSFALAYRDLGNGIKINALKNQLGFKYYFVAPRSCGGGSPRIVLLVDTNGDGQSDFALNGHVNPPSTAGCPSGVWIYQDSTDALPRWEVTPGGAVAGLPNTFPYYPWDVAAAAVNAAFPNHRVLAGFLADDSCSFFPASCGKAYYDLLTVENRTLEIWQDAVK